MTEEPEICVWSAEDFTKIEDISTLRNFAWHALSSPLDFTIKGKLTGKTIGNTTTLNAPLIKHPSDILIYYYHPNILYYIIETMVLAI